MNVLGLNAKSSGKTALVPVGSRIFLYFAHGEYGVSTSSDKVIKKSDKKFALPYNCIGVLDVIGEGAAEIRVTKKKTKQTAYATENSGNWSGYIRDQGSSAYTDIAGNWVVPSINSTYSERRMSCT